MDGRISSDLEVGPGGGKMMIADPLCCCCCTIGR